MVPFDVVTGRDDMVCNSGGVPILCKSVFRSCNRRLVLPR